MQQQSSYGHSQFRNAQEHIAFLERENAQLRTDKALLLVKNEQLKQQNRQLQGFLNWEDKLCATPSEKMSDAQKLLGRLVPRVLKKSRGRTSTDDTRDDGLTRAYRAEFAQGTGKSEDRVGANLKAMGEQGIIKHKVEDVRDAETHLVVDRLILIAETEQLRRADITAAEPRNKGNGQKHFICKDCHSAHTKVRRVLEVTCMDCGSVTYLDASKKEDKAFIVNEETVGHWDEWYGDVDTTGDEEAPIEPEPEPVEEHGDGMLPLPCDPPHKRPPCEPIPPCPTCGKTDRVIISSGKYSCLNHLGAFGECEI